MVIHTVKLLMADSFYSHPDTKFGISTVDMSAPIDPEEMIIDLDFHFKIMYTSNKVKTKININQKLLGSQ